MSRQPLGALNSKPLSWPQTGLGGAIIYSDCLISIPQPVQRATRLAARVQQSLVRMKAQLQTPLSGSTVGRITSSPRKVLCTKQLLGLQLVWSSPHPSQRKTPARLCTLWLLGPAALLEQPLRVPGAPNKAVTDRRRSGPAGAQCITSRPPPRLPACAGPPHHAPLQRAPAPPQAGVPL